MLFCVYTALADNKALGVEFS